MATHYTKATSGQRAALAVLMLLVLVLTAAGAWWLESAAARRVRAGARLLGAIRKDGLRACWPEKLRINWYILRDGTEPAGWRVVVAGWTGDAKVVGLNLDVLSDRVASEKWLLNADATEGAYIAVERGSKGASETNIDLAEGLVKVVQNGRRVARSPLPRNYMPEGLFEPVVRRVAATGADAQFKMVFNERPNVAGIVEFGTFRIRHQGRGKAADGQTTDRVRVTGVRGGKRRTIYYDLDPKGNCLRVHYGDGNLNWRRASREEVGKQYPQAEQILLRELPNALTAPPPERSLLDLPEVSLPQLVGAADEVGVGGLDPLGELEVRRALHVIGPRRHLAEQVQRRDLVDRRLDVAVGLERLVAVEAKDDLVVAVPGEGHLQGGPPDLDAGEVHQRPGRLGGDGEGPLDASGQRQHAQDGPLTRASHGGRLIPPPPAGDKEKSPPGGMTGSAPSARGAGGRR